MKRVLLIEPPYRNKYPPLGLMKLASYHRQRGDYVRFWKGEIRELLVEELVGEAVTAFSNLQPGICWVDLLPNFRNYAKTRKRAIWGPISEQVGFFAPTVKLWLDSIAKKVRNRRLPEHLQWDRVCVTTLFTFQWKFIIQTINEAKNLVKDPSELHVGGIAASLMPKDIEAVTGIAPFVGLLSEPGSLDNDDQTIIDELCPDYSILYETAYDYPENDGYLDYTTRGCMRRCPFCAVPLLEPKMRDLSQVDLRVAEVGRLYGERKNLLLLDNNVLASQRFDEIIDNIKQAGFKKGAKFRRPNQLNIAVKGLKSGWNDYGYRRHFMKQVDWLLSRLGKADYKVITIAIQNVRKEADGIPSKNDCFDLYEKVAPLYERHRYKGSVARYVDFNQGVDARLCTSDKMKKIGELAIRPLRIAFDNWSFREAYEKAVRLAAQNGIRYLSNYLLYNYNEHPNELWLRLELNIRLAEELDLDLFSFPMRYSPIFNEEGKHKNRSFLGPHWNRKFMRSIQCILNSTKGKVGHKRDFFEKAFGRNLDEYQKLLYMPENYIVLRQKSEKLGLTSEWWNLFANLSAYEKKAVMPIILDNVYTTEKALSLSTENKRIALLLEHYKVNYNEIKNGSVTRSDFKQVYHYPLSLKEQKSDQLVPL